jgi:hypothetical protein
MKNKRQYSLLLLFLILILALAVRFYNFAGRITFGPEQAISLLVSADYINEKFSLLGLPSTQRTTSHGHIIFYPPVFNYSLVPLILVSDYKVVSVTAFFAFLNVFTGALLFYITRKFFNNIAAFFTVFLFLFNDLMINHSMFVWSVNYLPLIGVLSVYFLLRAWKKTGLKDAFFLGVLSGLAFSVEYLYIPTGLLILLYLLIKSDKKLITGFLFITGGFLSLLPTVLFDLTHDFYHLRTLWQYFLDTVFLPSQSKITYYHFLHLWPVGALIGGIILSRVYGKSKVAAVVLGCFLVILSINSPRVSFSGPVGMYPGLDYPALEKAASLIAAENPDEFNVVTTFDFDSRAHPLRYLLKYNHGFKPMGVEDYPVSKQLYVFTTGDYSITDSSLWEITSFNGKGFARLESVSDFALYKLVK